MGPEPKLLAASLAALALAGCETAHSGIADNFGEANRQTMMAQVIDPTPVYEEGVAPSSGDNAAQAIDRLRKGTIKKPERIRTTNVGEQGGGGGGGSGN